MTARWMSDAWFAEVGDALDGLSGPPTLEGTVVVEVVGGPDGDAAGHLTFAGGRLVEVGPGPVAGADLTLTLSDTDAREVVTGDLDPSVAFMQGRMKVAGAMAPLLDLLALAGTEAGRARLVRVGGLTEF